MYKTCTHIRMCMRTVTCTQHIQAHTYTKTDIIFGVYCLKTTR